MGEASVGLDLEEHHLNNGAVFTIKAKMAQVPDLRHVVMVVMDDDSFDDGTSETTGDHQGTAAHDGAEPWDAWLPVTESRKGNTVKAVFHLVCSGIGFQTLLLPVALATLGWTWGITILTLAFAWQLYTIWVLVHLHESPSGIRYSRYLHLTIHAFGPKLGKLLGIFPVMYLSGGTCVMLIITGGGAMRTLFTIICGDADTCQVRSLTGAGWFMVFTCVAIAVAQLPNLNSVAGVSLVGAITAVAYCTIIWVLAVQRGHSSGDVSYEPLLATAGKSGWARTGNALNAVGIIALTFRGHNLILEIQGTLPSSSKEASKEPMWRAVMISYSLVSLCFYPLAVAGFWAYGDKIPSAGMLGAISNPDMQQTPKFLLGLVNLLVILNTLCVFQIYVMPVFDNLEIRYTSITGRRRCTPGARTCLRLFFGGLAFLISVAFPFLGSLAPLIGGLASPLTFAYPCLMWVRIRKPREGGAMWRLNSGLGCLGLILATLLVAAALWNLIDRGLQANFFKP